MKYITILLLLISSSLLAQKAPSLYGTPHAEHDVYYDIKAGDTIFIYATFQYTFGFEGYISFRFEYPEGGVSLKNIRIKEYLGKNPEFTQNNAWYKFALVVDKFSSERFTPGIYQFTLTYWSSETDYYSTYSKVSKSFEIKKKEPDTTDTPDIPVGMLNREYAQEEVKYYDLQGREVEHPRSGNVYIYKTSTGKAGRLFY